MSGPCEGECCGSPRTKYDELEFAQDGWRQNSEGIFSPRTGTLSDDALDAFFSGYLTASKHKGDCGTGMACNYDHTCVAQGTERLSGQHILDGETVGGATVSIRDGQVTLTFA
jgi:hypothetical protein